MENEGIILKKVSLLFQIVKGHIFPWHTLCWVWGGGYLLVFFQPTETQGCPLCSHRRCTQLSEHPASLGFTPCAHLLRTHSSPLSALSGCEPSSGITASAKPLAVLVPTSRPMPVSSILRVIFPFQKATWQSENVTKT